MRIILRGFWVLLAAAWTLAPTLRAQEAGAPLSVPADTLADYARREPAVAAALEMSRDTLAQQLRVVLVLIDLGRPQAAAFVLPELLKTQVNQQTGAELVAEFGPARFMELIRLDQPADAGMAPNPLAGVGKFAQACLDAAAAEANDPQRLADLLARLQSAEDAVRVAARNDLRASGSAAVKACFEALARAKADSERANLMAALVEMRPLADEPLLAVLADGRGTLRRDAIELAGHSRLAAALPWLAALATSADPPTAAAAQAAIANQGLPLPTPQEAQELIRRRLTDIEAIPLPELSGLKQTWWSWDPAATELRSAEFVPADIRSLAAARLTRLLLETGGAVPAGQLRVAAVRALEEAALLGHTAPAELQAVVGKMTPQDLSSALAEAASGERYSSAVALAAELGRRGDPTVLSTLDGRPSPLAAALASRSSALRYAALDAVMRLSPTERFPGGSAVAPALWHFALGAGDPAAVAAAPVYVRASDWAGSLRGLGLDATPAGSGREALVVASNPAIAPRLAVVMLDSDLGEPLLGEVVFQIRSTETLARTPVLIASSAGDLSDVQQRYAADRLTVVAPRPRDAESFKSLVDRTLASAPEGTPSSEVRRARAAQSLRWIAQALERRAPFDELLRDVDLVAQTLHQGDLTEPSLAVLAVAGVAESQALLLDYASSRTLPEASRRQAAAAFARSVERFGKQVASDQILEQYDRYNASESADPATQEILGSLLDVLETK